MLLTIPLKSVLLLFQHPLAIVVLQGGEGLMSLSFTRDEMLSGPVLCQ